MAVISTPPIWQQNRAYSARLDRQFADVFFGEGVIDPAGGDFLVAATSPTTNSVSVATGRAVVTGDDEVNQGKYLIVSESTLNVLFSAAPGSDARIDLVVLRVNDPVAGGPAGNNATVEVIEGAVAPVPVAPALPDSAIPLAEVLRTAGDTSITSGTITDVRATAAIVPATALTANGDLLTRNAGASTRIPVGSAGLPLLAGSPIPGYAQVDTVGIKDGAITPSKLASNTLKLRQIAYVEDATSYTVTNTTQLMTNCQLTFTPTAAGSILYVQFNADARVYWTTGAATANRSLLMTMGGLAGLTSARDGGRFLPLADATTDTATSTIPFTMHAIGTAPNTSPFTYQVNIQTIGITGLVGFYTTTGPSVLTIMEFAP